MHVTRRLAILSLCFGALLTTCMAGLGSLGQPGIASGSTSVYPPQWPRLDAINKIYWPDAQFSDKISSLLRTCTIVIGHDDDSNTYETRCVQVGWPIRSMQAILVCDPKKRPKWNWYGAVELADSRQSRQSGPNLPNQCPERAIVFQPMPIAFVCDVMLFAAIFLGLGLLYRVRLVRYRRFHALCFNCGYRKEDSIPVCPECGLK